MSGQADPATLDEAELVAWGRQIGATAALPLVLALRGDLGAGKSVLARAIARGAGIEGPMPSPTFNLLHVYRGPGLDLYHLDLYRLEEPEEVWELGWSELGGGPDLILIEWPERAESLLPADRWDVYLEPSPAGDAYRVVRAERRGRAPDVAPLAAVGQR